MEITFMGNFFIETCYTYQTSMFKGFNKQQH